MILSGYASSKKITGPYKNKEGKLINDALNYNKGVPILETPNPQTRFNGFGCMTPPVIDKDGQYWVMMHGHDQTLAPIMSKIATEERYTFLIPLFWDKKGYPYFDLNLIVNENLAAPKF